jgi:hypothetical protein
MGKNGVALFFVSPYKCGHGLAALALLTAAALASECFVCGETRSRLSLGRLRTNLTNTLS